MDPKEQSTAADWPNGRPGDAHFVVTVEADPWGTGATQYDIDFSWDGEASFATFVWDISEGEDLSSGSSSPASGWISWIKDGKLTIAFEHTDLGAAAAATRDVTDLEAADLSVRAPWASMASAITGFITQSM